MTVLADDGISLVTFDIGNKPVKIEARQIGQQVVCDRHEIVTAFDNGLIIRTSVIWNQVVPDKLTFALWTGFDRCYGFAANENCTKIALLAVILCVLHATNDGSISRSTGQSPAVADG